MLALETKGAASRRNWQGPHCHLSNKTLQIPPRRVVDGEPIIVARDLTCRFCDFTAVDRVSFTIERGEIFGFLGLNGSGKTTTMKMLTGLLAPASGEALLFGKRLGTGDMSSRYRVGYMSQSFSLYTELTVRQNLELHAHLYDLPPDKAKARIAELVAWFGLGDYLDQRTSNLESNSKIPLPCLSGLTSPLRDTWTARMGGSSTRRPLTRPWIRSCTFGSRPSISLR